MEDGSPYTCEITKPGRHVDFRIVAGADIPGANRTWTFFAELAILAHTDERLASLMNEYVIEIEQAQKDGLPNKVLWPI